MNETIIYGIEIISILILMVCTGILTYKLINRVL